jgi:hypothetical protein
MLNEKSPEPSPLPNMSLLLPQPLFQGFPPHHAEAEAEAAIRAAAAAIFTILDICLFPQ